MVRLRIKEIAEQQGLDRAKLARRADVAYGTVHDVWNNPEDDNITLKKLKQIAAALGVSVRDLLEEVGE